MRVSILNAIPPPENFITQISVEIMLCKIFIVLSAVIHNGRKATNSFKPNAEIIPFLNLKNSTKNKQARENYPDHFHKKFPRLKNFPQEVTNENNDRKYPKKKRSSFGVTLQSN
jgi:hypothetical protein